MYKLREDEIGLIRGWHYAYMMTFPFRLILPFSVHQKIDSYFLPKMFVISYKGEWHSIDDEELPQNLKEDAWKMIYSVEGEDEL